MEPFILRYRKFTADSIKAEKAMINDTESEETVKHNLRRKREKELVVAENVESAVRDLARRHLNAEPEIHLVWKDNGLLGGSEYKAWDPEHPELVIGITVVL